MGFSRSSECHKFVEEVDGCLYLYGTPAMEDLLLSPCYRNVTELSLQFMEFSDITQHLHALSHLQQLKVISPWNWTAYEYFCIWFVMEFVLLFYRLSCSHWSFTVSIYLPFWISKLWPSSLALRSWLCLFPPLATRSFPIHSSCLSWRISSQRFLSTRTRAQ